MKVSSPGSDIIININKIIGKKKSKEFESYGFDCCFADNGETISKE